MNNPYLIDLLVYLIKKSFSLEYDTPLTSADIVKIEDALSEQGYCTTEGVLNFFTRNYRPGIGVRYFFRVTILDFYCKIISCDNLKYVDWRAFSQDNYQAASGFDIRGGEVLTRDQKHEYYFQSYKEIKEQIRQAILSRFDPPSEGVLSMEVYFDQPPYLIGKQRSDELQKLATYLLNPIKPLGIIGMAGSGKTNFAENLIADKKVENLYGAHRFIMHCEAATSYEFFLAMLARVTRTPPMQQLADQEDLILFHLKRLEGKKLILFDNFETCDENYPYELFPFLSKLEAQATAVYTRRGEAPPQGPEWKVFKVPPLTEEEATDLFHYHSDRKFEGDPYVSRFLQEVEYLPLAVVLIAKRANGRARLESLYAEWEEKKLEMLRIKAYANNKNFNLMLSISLSYASSRLTDVDRQLLKALCAFPSPISLEMLKKCFNDAYEQTDSLISVGLLKESELGRLEIHATIREFMKVQMVETELYLSLLTDLYLDMAISIDEKRKNAFQLNKEWQNFCQNLTNEWENLYQALIYSVHNKKGIEALCTIRFFACINGHSHSMKPLFKQAFETAKAFSWKQQEAACQSGLANIEIYDEYREWGEMAWLA